MPTCNWFRILTSSYLLVLFICFNDAKIGSEKYYMDKMCGNDPLVFDGDNKPGISLQLTSSTRYKNNINCTVKFRTPQPSQRLIVTMERLDIVDCPGDALYIYDGTTLLNRDPKQQCGTGATFTFTTSAAEMTMIFKSNAAIESSGFQAAVALHFPMVASCPQSLGFFQCRNRNCISKQLQCDGRNHCGDGTDEQQCGILSG